MARRPRRRTIAPRPQPMVAASERVIVRSTALPPRRRRRRSRKSRSGNSGLVVAYAPNPPVAGGYMVGRPIPDMYTRDGVVCIKNTEYSLSFSTSAAFGGSVVNVVPHSFPWLNGIAQNYSKFRWKSFRFIYIPACSTTTSGTVSMMYQYDIPDSSPTSVQQMSMSNGFVTTPVWNGSQGCSMLANINSPVVPGAVVAEMDLSRLDKPWYQYITGADFIALTAVALTGPAVGNSYSPGNIFIATENGPAAPANAGILYAQYDCELIEPITNTLNY